MERLFSWFRRKLSVCIVVLCSCLLLGFLLIRSICGVVNVIGLRKLVLMILIVLVSWFGFCVVKGLRY